MKEIKGDLIKLAKAGEFDIIIQGCNCFCTMGKGIAPQIKKAFPEAYEADLKTIKGDRDKLGTVSVAYNEEHKVGIVNAYAQYDYRPTEIDDLVRRTDYEALRSCFKLIKAKILYAEMYQGLNLDDVRIGYPKIGCGLAGGDWNIVSKIIDEELEGLDHTLVEYEG